MIQTNYAGSISNYESVKRQISERWSEKEASQYDPKTNCMSYRKWLENGFYVMPNEKALHSIVIVEKKDKNGKITDRYPKKVALFYRLQVQKIEN